jgi:hypothetical protein
MEDLVGNKYLSGMVALLLVLYAVFVAPALPNQVLSFFDTAFGKLLFIFLAAYVASEGDIQVSVMIGVALFVTLHFVNRNKVQEHFYEGFATQKKKSDPTEDQKGQDDHDDDKDDASVGSKDSDDSSVAGYNSDDSDDSDDSDVSHESHDSPKGVTDSDHGAAILHDKPDGDSDSDSDDDSSDNHEEFVNYTIPGSGANLLDKGGLGYHAPVRF